MKLFNVCLARICISLEESFAFLYSISKFASLEWREAREVLASHGRQEKNKLDMRPRNTEGSELATILVLGECSQAKTLRIGSSLLQRKG